MRRAANNLASRVRNFFTGRRTAARGQASSSGSR
nr:MAG TPA: hypothetical protein [Caudoviricetes sp.]